MATLATVLSYARQLASTDSNGLSDANGINFANDAMYDMRRKLIDKREDLFIQESQRDITTTELTTGSAPGKFLFPSDMWFLKAIQVNMVNVNNKSLYTNAQQIDASNLSNGQSWEYMKANQPVDRPMFDFRGDWFEIIPTPTSVINQSTIPATNALKIFYFLAPTDFVATSDTLTFPESLDYRTLSAKIASLYLMSVGDASWQLQEQDYLKRLEDMIGVIGSGVEQPLTATNVRITGWEF